MSAPQARRPRSGMVLRIRGLMKPFPTKGGASMSIKLTRYRHSRKPNSMRLPGCKDVQRRIIGRPTAPDRLFRAQGYSPSVAILRATEAGFPLAGD